MPTFGFSAYLKLLCLSSRRQKTEIRHRANPKPGGYDYHRSFRLRAHRLIVDGESLDDVLRSAVEIVKAPERKSAIAALEKLSGWRKSYPGTVLEFEPAIYESPHKEFKVAFTPNFGIRLGNVNTAIHIWNNVSPDLDGRFVRSALALFPELYERHENKPDDFAVLCLRTSTLFRLSDGSEGAEFGSRVAEAIERLFRDAKEAETGKSRKPGQDKPTPSPPGP